ncbi:hypothetical protein LLH00_04020 [bacterium]|nr:hypothetical protein [bacterium]
MEQWEKPLFYYLRRLSGDESRAWELLGRCWRALAVELGARGDRERFKVRLYRLARQTAEREIPELTQPSGGTEPTGQQSQASQALSSFGDPAALHRGLDSLELQEREIMTLVLLEDFTPEELGRILRLTTGRARTRLERARNALWRILNGKEVLP